MSEKKFKAIYGTRDIMPNEAPTWGRVIDTVSRLASDCGYGFIHPPIFEATELFARGIGEATDIVSKEMYTFKDQGDRSLTLRPEGTASVVRAYLEHSLGAKEGLVKVWYAGPMFRQERPQAGRLRQFYQFGVEAIGSLNPALDAEVIDLNYRILSALGLDGMRVFINSIGMAEDRQAHKRAFSAFVEPILDKFCADCQRRFQTNPLRMFDCKEKGCQALLTDAPIILDYLSEDNRAHFEQVQQYLLKTGVPFNVDKRLVRGLDYYTRTAWEIRSDKLGSQDSLSGGGRYDLLVEQLGGPPTPGIGFAAGIERIIMAMPESRRAAKTVRQGVFVVAASEQYRPQAYFLAHRIRHIGAAAETDYLGRSMKGQMKQADRSGLNFAVILAENEMSGGRVIIKDLVNSKQFEVELVKLMNIQSMMQLGELLEQSE
ncbi:MAG: histidine--tRNA ligase [candidate division Zixibacteria bacterium RBG_16_53_22]|nr:MAG: histidine--tRNA ligase [candidate division Zixibacteria bacterium RBG_16_53_22]